MSNLEALLAAVCATPDDDTSRLVFADWLDENGTTKDAKRTAHLRADVQLRRLLQTDTDGTTFAHYLQSYSTDPLDSAAWSGLAPDLDAICAAITTREAAHFPIVAQTEGLPKIRGVTFEDFERGFCSQVRINNPSAFAANAETIFRTAPITGLAFEQLNAEQARAFVSSGHLKRIRRLKLDSTDPQSLRILGEHPDAAGVTSLRVGCGTNPGEVCEHLAAGKHWTAVTHLEITDLATGAEEPDDCIVPILRMRCFRGLHRLRLQDNQLGDPTAEAIADGRFTELRTVDLSGNMLTDMGVEALAAAPSLGKLRTLDLSMNDHGPDGMSAVLISPKLAKLTVLRMDSCYSGGFHARTLKRTSRGPTLRVLDLGGMELTAAGMALFAKSPVFQGLWYLRMDSCSLEDSALRSLTASKAFRSLRGLDLANNNLTTKGIEMLAKWPVPLRHLVLIENKIGVLGAKAIIAAEHLQDLRLLMVTGAAEAPLRKHFGKQIVR
jgi:uncharacterized protein (TIGR02996 family)